MSIKAIVLVERHEKVIAFVLFALGMRLFAPEQQSHVTKTRRQILSPDHK
ncbi:hypothetical protein V4R08_15520 (plasmid) [Nitrobacter sp. NHB1]